MTDPLEFDYAASLAACARRDAAALQRLYERESPRLLGVVQRIVRNRPQAEDIVHDAFVNIWNRAHSFDASRGDARGWIYTVARNLALNAVRKGAREIASDDAALAAADAEVSLAAWRDTEDAFAWQQVSGRLARCLEALDPVRRNCLLHAYVDGLSQAEIAQRISAPLGTVKAWIRRSLTGLKECLQ
jgi:RNA polymerase sigma-70 factor (ECF subfamily)